MDVLRYLVGKVGPVMSRDRPFVPMTSLFGLCEFDQSTPPFSIHAVRHGSAYSYSISQHLHQIKHVLLGDLVDWARSMSCLCNRNLNRSGKL